jgi:RNA polymerase sigma factor (TIGR02999 family)
MSETDPQTVTNLLLDWRQGNEKARQDLMTLVYDELHRRARMLMRSERREHTLQATALVHEAYLRLAQGKVPAHDRSQFFAIAASSMRRVLVDHARARNRAKRGGGAIRVTLGDGTLASPGRPDDLLQLDEVAAHLDAVRRAALYEEILDLGAQAWLTGTDVADFDGLAGRAQFFSVHDGTVHEGARAP